MTPRNAFERQLEPVFVPFHVSLYPIFPVPVVLFRAFPFALVAPFPFLAASPNPLHRGYA